MIRFFCIVPIAGLFAFAASACCYAQSDKESVKQSQQTFTAPPPGYYVKKKAISSSGSQPEPSKPENAQAESLSYFIRDAHFEMIRREQGNADNLPPGYYASYTPPVPDTIMVYEGGTDVFLTLQTSAGKEIINSADSGTILDEIAWRQYKLKNVRDPRLQQFELRQGKINSTVTRTGFVPGQGFGTNRFRFTIKPGNFSLRRGAMISASVHCRNPENNIGNILCAVTSIDPEHNTFTVETSNEVPMGEDINWIIINYPDMP